MILEKYLFVKYGFMKILLLVFLFFITYSCVPKQVTIYQPIEGMRNDIIQYAVALLGKPYRSGAKGPDAFDCSGFIYYIFKKVNITLPVMTEELIKTGYSIPRDSILPGDLVFFKVKKNFHSGILLNNTDFIHSSTSRGISVDNIDSKYWRKTLIGFRSVL